jgi:hypothetical protein
MIYEKGEARRQVNKKYRRKKEKEKVSFKEESHQLDTLLLF